MKNETAFTSDSFSLFPTESGGFRPVGCDRGGGHKQTSECFYYYSKNKLIPFFTRIYDHSVKHSEADLTSGRSQTRNRCLRSIIFTFREQIPAKILMRKLQLVAWTWGLMTARLLSPYCCDWQKWMCLFDVFFATSSAAVCQSGGAAVSLFAWTHTLCRLQPDALAQCRGNKCGVVMREGSLTAATALVMTSPPV